MKEDIGYSRTKEAGRYNSIKNSRDYRVRSHSSKDTPSEAKIREVRKELAKLIKQKLKEYPNKSENLLVNTCRTYINVKYGKGWRERGLITNDENQWKELSSYKDPNFNWDYELNN